MLNVSAALWILELDSELLFVGDAGNTEPSRASRRFGIEVPIYYRLNDRWMFDVELALSNSRFTHSDGSGDEVPGSVDSVFAAGAMADLGNGAFGTLRVRHFGDRPLVEDGTVRSGSSTVWNLGLGYRLVTGLDEDHDADQDPVGTVGMEMVSLIASSIKLV